MFNWLLVINLITLSLNHYATCVVISKPGKKKGKCSGTQRSTFNANLIALFSDEYARFPKPSPPQYPGAPKGGYWYDRNINYVFLLFEVNTASYQTDENILVCYICQLNWCCRSAHCIRIWRHSGHWGEEGHRMEVLRAGHRQEQRPQKEGDPWSARQCQEAGEAKVLR